MLPNSGYLWYEDGHKVARNPTTKGITPAAKHLASIEILVDKMHMAGHVDKWCKENCNEKNLSELDVSVQACTLECC